MVWNVLRPCPSLKKDWRRKISNLLAYRETGFGVPHRERESHVRVFLLVETDDEDPLTDLGDTELYSVEFILKDAESGTSEEAFEFFKYVLVTTMLEAQHIFKNEEID